MWLIRLPTKHLQSIDTRFDRSGAFVDRIKAASTHITASIVVACGVLALVYLGWYPSPLDSISGVGEILVLLLAIDVTLGPLLTLTVFDRRKKDLHVDLACIASIQVAALAYGLYTVETGRPHYVVFVKDRFEVVSRADLQTQDLSSAVGNTSATISWLRPKIVAAEMPATEQERKDLLFESALGGRDIQHFPKQYRDYGLQASQAAAKAMSLAELRTINPHAGRLLRSAVAASGLSESQLRFLPIKGPKGDAVMLIEVPTGAIAGMVPLQPWR